MSCTSTFTSKSGATPADARVRVHKFGGALLADGGRVRRAAAALVERARAARERPVAVVSAVGEVTALLDAAAREAAAGRPDTKAVRLRHKRLLSELDLEPGLLNRYLSELESLLIELARRGECSPAERDHVLSFGERMSARVFAAALRAAGAAATPVDAWELGLISDSNHGRARPVEGALAAVGRALDAVPGVPVVTGFVAADRQGRLTTLGRNGSDFTAALVAEAAFAAEACFWKAVDGVMSADPRVVAAAHTLRELTWSQAAALSFHGAGVLHPEALAPLERARIEARVLCLDSPADPGTRIGARGAQRGWLGLAARRNVVRARLRGDAAAVHAALAGTGAEALEVCALPQGVEVYLIADDAGARFLAGQGASAELERGLCALSLVAAHPLAEAGGAPAGLLAGAAELGLLRLRVLDDAVRWLCAEADLERAAHALHALAFPAPAADPALPLAEASAVQGQALRREDAAPPFAQSV